MTKNLATRQPSFGDNDYDDGFSSPPSTERTAKNYLVDREESGFTPD
jgi:hypothetical protein